MNDPSLHVPGTLQREGHKGSYCFDSRADKQILLFQPNIPGTQNASLKKQYHKTLSCHPSDIRKTTVGSDSPTEATDHCPSPRRATRGTQTFRRAPYRAASSRQRCPCLPYRLTHIPPYWVACRDKNKTTAASFCYMASASPPPQSFSAISVELICTTTFQGNLEGTVGF